MLHSCTDADKKCAGCPYSAQEVRGEQSATSMRSGWYIRKGECFWHTRSHYFKEGSGMALCKGGNKFEIGHRQVGQALQCMDCQFVLTGKPTSAQQLRQVEKAAAQEDAGQLSVFDF